MRKTKAELVDEIKRLEESVARLESQSRNGGESLADKESLFRNLAESSSAHITIIQQDRYVYANQAFLDYHMLDAEDLKLITPEELMMGVMTPEAMRKAEPAWRAAIESGERHFQFELEDIEGNWFQTTVTMMELDGRPAFMIMDIDITELKRAQKEMYRTDKLAALGQIIAGVAHEINNPNNFIYFNLPVLRKYLDAVASFLEQKLFAEQDLEILDMPIRDFINDFYKLIENMEHGSARINSIVSTLKNYVRNDVVQDWKVQPVDGVIDAVMRLIGKQVRKMVKRFDVEIAEGLASVKMNEGKIEQVLINLLLNAAQAADKEESWIKLTARSGGFEDGKDCVLLVIEDNGAGIPKRHLEKIFDPFFTSKGREQGTGLGLSISHRIIEEHQGTISVESQPEKGSRFVVRLPASDEKS